MSTLIHGDELRAIALGSGPASKATGTLTNGTTKALFTVTGGQVLITALWAVVTTSMTGANTLALQTNPTAGDTVTVVAATDLGTTDSAAGSTIGVTGHIADPADTGADDGLVFLKGGRALRDLVVTTGDVELVETGSGTINGAATFYCTWVPLTNGATLAAAA